VQVRVTDATNTPIPNAGVSIGFSGTPPCAAATLGGTLTQTTDATGTATFPDLAIIRGQTASRWQPTAGNVIGVSNAFNVEGFCDTGGLAVAAYSTVPLLCRMARSLLGGTASYTSSTVLSSAELYNPATIPLPQLAACMPPAPVSP